MPWFETITFLVECERERVGGRAEREGERVREGETEREGESIPSAAGGGCASPSICSSLTASERRGSTLKGCEDFGLKAKAQNRP